MKKLVIFILALSATSCAQTKKQDIKTQQPMYDITNFIEPEAKDVTQTNYVEKLYSHIQHYPKEPIYYLRINKQNCLIEVDVNDVSQHDDYELSNYITPFDIVGKILKSGEQTVTVRMYPVGNLINESFGREGEPITELQANASVQIKIIQIDNKSAKSFDDEMLVITHQSPTDSTGEFVGAGKPYYEYSFTFNAQVPYTFEGWSKGQDLRKLNRTLLTQKALEFYKMSQQILANNDLNAWLKLNYPSDIRAFGSLYVDEQYLKELLDEQKETCSRDYTIIPINKYKLEFKGGGKLVVLNHTNPDPFYRGVYAAELEYTNKEGYLSSYFPGITLYLPEGRSLEEGLLMWK